MTRRSSGKGTRPLSTAIDENIYAALEQLAKSGGVTINRYVRVVVEDAVKRGKVVNYGIYFAISEQPEANITPIVSLKAAEESPEYQTGKEAKKTN